MVEIGRGSRRVCLRIPGEMLCVKRYRDDDGVGPTVGREIARFRFDRARNTCAQEYDYIQSLKPKLPPEVFAVFPERMELKRDPVHGWHLVESVVLDGDGSPSCRFSQTYLQAPGPMRRRLLVAFRELMHAFEVAAVKFYDPQNVLVQWEGVSFASGFRLRVVDMDPVSRAFLPVDQLCDAFRRMKLRRRVRRYLWRQLSVRYDPLPWRERVAWDEWIATQGAASGLSGCRALAENEHGFDIVYEGFCAGRPCAVKCAARNPQAVPDECERARRLHADDPARHPGVLAFSPGPMAFVAIDGVANMI